MQDTREEAMTGAAVARTTQTRGRRLNLVLADQTYAEVDKLSTETRRTISELLRFGLALVRIAIQERNLGHKLMVTRDTGEPIKEIVLPF